MTTPEQRPPLTSALSGAGLQRWYWLETELVDVVRAPRASPGGGKQELTVRLAAALDGNPEPSSPSAGRTRRHVSHPRSDHADALSAWRRHRSLPVDQR